MIDNRDLQTVGYDRQWVMTDNRNDRPYKLTDNGNDR